MSGALWFLASASLVLLVLASTVLVTPVKLAVTIRTSPRWRLKVVARLLGGLLPAISIHDNAHRRRQRRPPKTRKKLRIGSRQTSARLIRVISVTSQLLAGLLRPIHLRRLTVDADIGLADPADTGQLFGLLAAVIHSRPPTPAVSIAVRPDFAGLRGSGALDAELSFIPVAFVPPGIQFAWRVFGSGR